MNKTIKRDDTLNGSEEADLEKAPELCKIPKGSSSEALETCEDSELLNVDNIHECDGGLEHLSDSYKVSPYSGSFQTCEDVELFEVDSIVEDEGDS